MEEQRNPRILVADDEDHLREIIRFNLELENYQVEEAKDGAEAIRIARSGRFDLIVLDVMMPEIDGFGVCQTLRTEGISVPVLFLTARHTAQDRITGLRLGADDYLGKPFHLEELVLRVQRLIQRPQRTQGAIPEEYSFAGGTIDFKTLVATDRHGQKSELGKKEAQLLRLMIQRKGEVISRSEILETIWGYDVYPSTRTVDNYITTLRKIFEENPRQPSHIHSVRGIGYRFTP
jgi:two-component system alkaline phosphatase synthesis response regulator PhoP